MKLGNQYADMIRSDSIPKTVLAAIAFSLAMRLSEDDLAQSVTLVYSEWDTLYANGIVPQRPPFKTPK